MGTATVTTTGKKVITTDKDRVAADIYEDCPICGLSHPHLIHNFNPSYEADIISAVKKSFPAWETKQGICGRCFDRFEAVTYHPYRAPKISVEAFKQKHFDFYILPIAARLNADETYTGKGVTICFIDSGFYPHPDIKDRIVKVFDITDENRHEDYFSETNENAWHGTMTSTVCAGNGKLSNGLYKGLAPAANLVLIKTQNDAGKITDENIAKALMWVKNNHKTYNIKIINLSLSGDAAEKSATSSINQLAEELFNEDVLIVAAVGNNINAEVLPPASSLHVVAVGGLDDQNKLDGDIILYHSSFGIMANGLSKPELISNAIWLPAPILPQTDVQKKATVLFQALENEDYMQAIIQNNAASLKDEHFNLFEGKEKIWKEVKMTIWKEKFITPDYMHVDGTSFAAPIVSSVAAQMLEANPLLTAIEIRDILLKTAMPLPTYDAAHQGYGRLQPKMAVYAVVDREDIHFTDDDPIINRENNSITFYIHLPFAETSVSLSVSFNNWKKNEILLKPAKNNIWYVHIPMLPNGRYEYKYLVDNQQWVEDLANPWRVIDNYGGWNNVFEIN
jgi:serine protease AprX